MPIAELPSFFASLDRRLDKRKDPPEGEVDETRREVELALADIDKQMVLLAYGEGDLEQPLGKRVGDRLEKLSDEEWSKPLPTDPEKPLFVDYVRTRADQVAALMAG